MPIPENPSFPRRRESRAKHAGIKIPVIPAQEGGGQVINLPVLAHGPPRTYALLDYYSLGFRAACNDERVPLADQARVRQWLARFEAAIEPARVVLGMEVIAGS